jgi:hypothetical protein
MNTANFRQPAVKKIATRKPPQQQQQDYLQVSPKPSLMLPVEEKEMSAFKVTSPIQQMRRQGYLVFPRPHRQPDSLVSPKVASPQHGPPSVKSTVVTLPRPLSASNLAKIAGPAGSPRHAVQLRAQDRTGHVRGGFANTIGSSLTGVGLSSSPFVASPPQTQIILPVVAVNQ